MFSVKSLESSIEEEVNKLDQNENLESTIDDEEITDVKDGVSETKGEVSETKDEVSEVKSFEASSGLTHHISLLLLLAIWTFFKVQT